MAKSIFDDTNPLTFAEFDEYFHNSGAEKACPDCGETDWQIPLQPGGGTNTPILLAAYRNISNSQFVPAYLAYCGNCGHLKSYAADLVMRKIRDGKS